MVDSILKVSSIDPKIAENMLNSRSPVAHIVQLNPMWKKILSQASANHEEKLS